MKIKVAELLYLGYEREKKYHCNENKVMNILPQKPHFGG
jgi:hypothetical protein